MKINIVPIGTSRGIRIPKTVLEQCHIKDRVEMEILSDTIILKPFRKNPREGWEEACQMMHKNGEDQMLYDDSIDLDAEGWEW